MTEKQQPVVAYETKEEEQRAAAYDRGARDVIGYLQHWLSKAHVSKVLPLNFEPMWKDAEDWISEVPGEHKIWCGVETSTG